MALEMSIFAVGWRDCLMRECDCSVCCVVENDGGLVLPIYLLCNLPRFIDELGGGLVVQKDIAYKHAECSKYIAQAGANTIAIVAPAVSCAD
jgi:hypothetical protein